ncbi:MAG: glycoside hydrolase family 13 protein [Defluviitaleaceae bacterium]|nr:glycoside hydrolase family 13 protein [Defluviitaleaceae bacterium]
MGSKPEGFFSESVFSDETGNFISNPEPYVGETIRIMLRCAKDSADAVLLHVADFGIFMEKYKTAGVFDYYQAQIVLHDTIRYYFSVEAAGRQYFYNKRGLYEDIDQQYNFTIIPGFSTPGWAKNAVMYQIFVDRFYNGDTTNDVESFEYLYLGHLAKRVEDWGTPLENTDICNFYGGDLAGVMEKMDYLAELGAEVIYFNPLFVSPSNHKYDVQDYDYIDPHYGVIINDGGNVLGFDSLHNRHATMYMQRTTDMQNLEASNQLFIKLVEIARAKGIKVILDGVFNHCGAFNKWMDTEGFYGGMGAHHCKNSPYHDYFIWEDDDWPQNRQYDAWWGHDNHPKLNFEGSRQLYDEMLRIGAKWVSPPFNADGWRLDVAADLGRSKEFNHKFWRDFRDAVKKANPEAVIIAEHYGDPADWLDGRQWDSVMNYDAFMEPVSWFFTGMQKHSESFSADMLNNGPALEGAMRYFMAKLPHPALQSTMNQLSNHDHSRFLTRTNKQTGRLHTEGASAADVGANRAVMLAAVAMQFTWPGCPAVYYGDEAGLTGWTDPDNRRPYPWGREDSVILDFHKEVIKIHKSHSALRGGSLEFLLADYGVLAYGRWDNSQSIICVFNNNDAARELTIPIWRADVAMDCCVTRIMLTTENNFITKPESNAIENGLLKVIMPPFSSAIFLAEKN